MNIPKYTSESNIGESTMMFRQEMIHNIYNRMLARPNGNIKRLEYFANIIKEHGGKPEIHEYLRDYKNCYTRYNINENDDKADIVVTAHWDTAFTSGENCLDNTASCINLCKLSKLLIGVKDSKIVLAITDAEEPCNSMINGACYAVAKFKPELLIDFELTASGDTYLYDNYGDHGKIPNGIGLPKRMPMNNAMVVNQMMPSVSTVCVTMVSREESAMSSPQRWRYIHTKHDTFKNWYREKDCDRFVEHIYQIIKNHRLA